MKVLSKIKNAFRRPTKKDLAVLRHEDALCKYLQLGVTHLQIVDKINAFDWLEIQEAKSEDDMARIVLRFYESFNIQTSPAFRQIVVKAFTHRFIMAVEYFLDAIENVHQSYNVEGSSKGFQNDAVNKFYYISYWADKKNIPVNFNEKNQTNRDLFNFDTIILSILADKLQVFNNFERNKPKK